MIRRFTGWHMAGIFVAMFGVIIAVNVAMASFAARTFGGVVVENSYVASQRFNGWLEAAREQKALGWKADATLTADRAIAIQADAPEGPLDGAQVTAIASHPLGRAPDHLIRFRPMGHGRFVSRDDLPAGRWLLHIRVQRGSHEAKFEDEISR